MGPRSVARTYSVYRCRTDRRGRIDAFNALRLGEVINQSLNVGHCDPVTLQSEIPLK